MKQKNLLIIIAAFIISILNIFIFITMSAHVEQQPDFINMSMYYLTLIIIIVSLPVSYVGYRKLTDLMLYQRILAHMIFWTHVVVIGMFLGSIWFSLT